MTVFNHRTKILLWLSGRASRRWILYELPAHPDARRYGAIWGELKWSAGQELSIDSLW